MKKLYSVTNVLKKTWRMIYDFVIATIFEGKVELKKKQKMDSRTIVPPRYGSKVERIVLQNQCVVGVSMLKYSCNEVHSTIYWFKYRRDIYTVKLFARILFDEIIGQIHDRLDIRSSTKSWVLTPAPSTSYLSGEKTWDHNQDLVDEMKKIYIKDEKSLDLQIYFENIFTLNSKFQSAKNLSRNERLETSSHKFKIQTPKDLKNAGLIIFDDVTTTGATLKNLTELAETLNPRIILNVAIAH